MERVSYTAIPEFEKLFFEDSYVLAICLGTDYVDVKLDLVLTPAHPIYVAPAADQQHCMRRARLCFPDVSNVGFTWSGSPVATDADGEKDLGNIDVFYREDGRYLLYGQWGELRITSGTPTIVIDG